MKSFIILFAFFLVNSFSVYGQNASDSTNTKQNKYPTYASYKIHYPDLAEKNKIEGTVVIKYDIDANCSIVNRRFERKLGFGCDEEALKVLDQYETKLKEINKVSCNIEKDLLFPVKFKLSR
ncbi:MAG: energy transducer TonB [Bacteroidia bacterium]|nr:energy transducer TonB [Bacteroidia bacterium]